MDDPGFINRCQLWAALWSLLPDDKLEDARSLIAGLEREYWLLISAAWQAQLQAQRERDTCREELGQVERQLAEMSIAALALAEPPDKTH